MEDKNPEIQKTQGFVTWADDSGKQQVLLETSDNIDHYDGIQKSIGYRRRSFLDIETNKSVRTGFTREDYNRFRSEEAVPKKQKEAMQMCMAAYDKVGIVRNVIDLMADFASQGINLVHPFSDIFSATSFEYPFGALRPVPTAVPPRANSER